MIICGQAKPNCDRGLQPTFAYPDWPTRMPTRGGLLKDKTEGSGRQYGPKALAMLDSHTAPASTVVGYRARRGEIRSGLQDVLKKLGAARDGCF
jgi:hypothetical protein